MMKPESPDLRGAPPAAKLKLPRTVFALALVSLLTDASSEIIYPLLPLFLTATLGASAATLGVIEGAAETTASLLKLASGWWSDRIKRRKTLVGFIVRVMAATTGRTLPTTIACGIARGITRTLPRTRRAWIPFT